MALALVEICFVTVSSDRSIRVWNRSDEQLFLEEEREKIKWKKCWKRPC